MDTSLRAPYSLSIGLKTTSYCHSSHMRNIVTQSLLDSGFHVLDSPDLSLETKMSRILESGVPYMGQ